MGTETLTAQRMLYRPFGRIDAEPSKFSVDLDEYTGLVCFKYTCRKCVLYSNECPRTFHISSRRAPVPLCLRASVPQCLRLMREVA